MVVRKGTALAGVFGNALEWYDFTTYAFFATILAKLFFPAENSFTSLLITFSVFAAGFLVRPIGAVMFGYVGDYMGRRSALIVSIIVISVPTVLLGCLPTYAVWGIYAPIVLTLLRIVQGLAVSGELTTAASFLVEHAGEKHRGFAGSLAMASALVGILLSSITVMLITNTLSQTALESWGWRLPFWLGGLLGIVGLVIRLRTVEPELYEKTQQSVTKKRPSVWGHIGTLKMKPLLLATVLTGIMAEGNYFVIAFFVTFLTKNLGLPLHLSTLSNCVALGLWLTLIPAMGALSDRVGRKPVLLTALIALLLMIIPIFWILQRGTFASALVGQLLFVTCLAPLSALVPTTLAELFDVKTRNTGLSISYNVGQALFGGTAPLIAISLIAYTGNLSAPAWYFIASTLVALIAWYHLTESYQDTLR